jgi:hypothetical protein
MIYAVSALAVVFSFMAMRRPTIWSMFAAAVLNGVAAWLALQNFLGR